jgi:YD repeat-containing protein
MKKLFSLLLSLLLLLSLAGCSKEEVKEEKKVTTYVVAEQKTYSQNGELYSTTTFQYDDHGRPTVIELRYTNGRTHRAELTYDKHGNLIREETILIIGDKESHSVDVYSLSYSAGRLTHCDILDENGEEIECTTLLMFYSPETEKDIVIYTDNTVDENGIESMYASYYIYDDESLHLEDIDSNTDWELIQEVLSEIMANEDSVE